MRTLYPPIQPYVTHSLPVAAPHVLHAEECGNPSGLPVVFLHGGPGSGCEPSHRSFFDPDRYRIVLFDQRGSGKSTPHASLEDNTPRALIEDIETLRGHLGIERWLVFGGSWGSTLALLYAQAHPDRVLGLVLRGIFLCRPRDIHWFYQHGASALYPEAWEDYLRPIPENERHDLVAAYHRRLTGHDEVTRLAAARAWSLWEGRTATLGSRESVIRHYGDAHTALSLARIENHYFVNDCFLEEDQILKNAAQLSDIPGMIVHGRHDVICPAEQAWALHKAWPQARLEIIEAAGHSASEPGITDALIRATDAFADRFSASP